MKKMKYQLLAESTNIKLTKDVNKLLSAGWEPFGPPIISDGLFFQGVIYIPSEGKGKCADDK